jgi:hypothetical protein
MTFVIRAGLQPGSVAEGRKTRFSKLQKAVARLSAKPADYMGSRRQRCSMLGFTSQARATSVIDAPSSNRRTAASLNSRVNFRRDIPMTQFSIH